MKRLSSILCLLAFSISAPLSAQMQGGVEASPEQNANRVLVGGQLGFGGEFEIDADEGGAFNFDAGTSFGGVLEFAVPLHDLFIIGARASYTSAAVDDADIENVGFFSLFAVPKLRLPLSPAFELYGAVPLGVSFAFLPSEFEENGLEAGPDFAWGVMGGATFLVSPAIGVYGEAGLMNPSSTLDAGGEEGTLSLRQITLALGILINL